MRRTPLTAAMLLAVHLSACTSYQALANPSVELGASPMQLDEVRVTPVTGKRFYLTSSLISGDSLFGVRSGGDRTAIALSDVKRIEARYVSTTLVGTLFCVVAVFAVNAESCSVDSE